MVLHPLLPVTILLTTTAFAPAPFPKPKKELADPNRLVNLDGTWRLERYERVLVGGMNRPMAVAMKVQIEKNQWTYLTNTGNGERKSKGYRMVLDPKRKPAHIDLHNEQPAVIVLKGIYRVKGDQMEVLVVPNVVAANGGPAIGNARPVSFENPPQGSLRMVMRRENTK